MRKVTDLGLMKRNKILHQAELVGGNFYHIYNRTVGNEVLFASSANYRFFLKQYSTYLHPWVETYAYCLLGNHFHLLIRVRDKAINVDKVVNFPKVDDFNKSETIPNHEMVSGQFRKFFQSYVMAFNKQQERHGTLLQTPFKRVKVDSDNYLTKLIYYIHANPQAHGLTNDFQQWPWSSYSSLVSSLPTQLERESVLQLFDRLEGFEEAHEGYRQVLLEEGLGLE